MGLKNRLFAVYESSDAVTRSKALAAFWVLSIIAALLPVLIGVNLLKGSYLNIAVEVLMLAVMVFSLLLLFRGRFRAAVTVSVVTIAFGVTAVSFFLQFASLYEVYAIVVYMTLPVAMALVVDRSAVSVYLSGLWGVVVISGVSLTVGVQRTGVSLIDVITQQLIISLVLYFVLVSFLVRASRDGISAVRSVEENQNRLVRVLGDIRSVLSDASQGKDTVRAVSEGFNGIVSRLQEINGIVSILNERGEAVREYLESSLRLAEDTARRADGFLGQVNEQTAVVEETTAAINEMSASLSSIAQITAEHQRVAEGLRSDSREGVRQIGAVEEAFQAAKRQTESLMQINTIISDIADRTNLLSMNAAIEAAHAGESGKGFAVVAEEIRNLATSTSENTQTIEKDLKALVGFTTAARDEAGKLKGVVQKTSEGVEGIADAFGEIVHSTAELDQGGQEVLVAMHTARDAAATIRDNAEAIAREQEASKDRTEGMRTVVDDLSAAGSDIRDTADLIREEAVALGGVVRVADDSSERVYASIGGLVSEGGDDA